MKKTRHVIKLECVLPVTLIANGGSRRDAEEMAKKLTYDAFNYFTNRTNPKQLGYKKGEISFDESVADWGNNVGDERDWEAGEQVTGEPTIRIVKDE